MRPAGKATKLLRCFLAGQRPRAAEMNARLARLRESMILVASSWCSLYLVRGLGLMEVGSEPRGEKSCPRRDQHASDLEF